MTTFLEWIVVILGLIVVGETIHQLDLYSLVDNIYLMALAWWNAFESHDIPEDYAITIGTEYFNGR